MNLAGIQQILAQFPNPPSPLPYLKQGNSKIGEKLKMHIETTKVNLEILEIIKRPVTVQLSQQEYNELARYISILTTNSLTMFMHSYTIPSDSI
jgi:hypothetical protein